MQIAGILIALCLLAGAFTGIFVGQPSLGAIAGLGVGILLAIIIAVVQRS
ncbi:MULTISPECIES: hypothetical protein [Pacificimonas]|uniref:CTP synthetase n=1 Tax=Pacificimonas aurantium TaxID=1250540 RepID=A0ABS7WLH8_9SPHN|nr:MULTISPECIES: hypothetical protein [Pacificimonas]MBZ6379253.1 hypothetical protein [Pacificimonas aurantium]